MKNDSFRFSKMHGLGNDYIYFNCLESPLPNPEAAAITLSDRHFGIGGDGIVLIENSDSSDFKMRMFNADGSEAEMCGNAIRCVGKFIYDNQISAKNKLTIETKAGQKVLDLITENNIVKEVKVDMGYSIFDPNLIPCLINADKILDQDLEVSGTKFKVNVVSVGNPHCVIFCEEITNDLVLGFGPLIENHKVFPKKVNVEFVKIHNRKLAEMRVWERGSGETLACGTGASAVAIVGQELGLLDREVTIKLRGGDLKVNYLEDNKIINIGPATLVYTGIIDKVW